VKVVVLSDVVS